MSGRVRVLMVCMGNICRSPTAQAVLGAQVRRAGLARRVQVDSAGTHGWHAGEAPDVRAVRHAAARGYDLSGLRARRVLPEDFHRFDRVLAMDEANLARLADLRPPGAAARPGLLLAHARRFPGLREVPDPYYGPPAAFERVLDLLEDACEGLLLDLQAEGAF